MRLRKSKKIGVGNLVAKTGATLDHKYPIGPLSLYQLGYFERSQHPYDQEDAYTRGVKAVAQFGIYPTFGHMGCRYGRWFSDLTTGRNHPIAITRR